MIFRESNLKQKQNPVATTKQSMDNSADERTVFEETCVLYTKVRTKFYMTHQRYYARTSLSSAVFVLLRGFNAVPQQRNRE